MLCLTLLFATFLFPGEMQHRESADGKRKDQTPICDPDLLVGVKSNMLVLCLY